MIEFKPSSTRVLVMSNDLGDTALREFILNNVPHAFAIHLGNSLAMPEELRKDFDIFVSGPLDYFDMPIAILDGETFHEGKLRKPFFLAHGHQYGTKGGHKLGVRPRLKKLGKDMEKGGCDFAIIGNMHKPYDLISGTRGLDALSDMNKAFCSPGLLKKNEQTKKGYFMVYERAGKRQFYYEFWYKVIRTAPHRGVIRRKRFVRIGGPVKEDSQNW